MQSSRIITSINVEGELKGSHYGERASFDPRPELPAFERPSFSLSVNLAYRSKAKTMERFGVIAMGLIGQRYTFPRPQQNGVVISGKHKKDRAAFSITGIRGLLSRKSRRNGNDIPSKGRKRQGRETKGTSRLNESTYVLSPLRKKKLIPLVIPFNSFSDVSQA
ncbi:unnamed protein product [Lasius platythorax]|uniref:Ribosomal protein S3 n=1 Tax=Lasius platythorax TaxID=488582 RepID=A0AAV2N1D9_9HYME